MRDTAEGLEVRTTRPSAFLYLVLNAGSVCLAGCAGSTPGDELVTGPVVIARSPEGGEGGGAVDDYYASILTQMREAYGDRDPGRLESLLAMHDREDAPEWAALAMSQYRALLRALGFELELQRVSRLGSGDAELFLDSRPQLLHEIGPVPGGRARLSGREDEHPARFEVAVRVFDEDAFGARIEASSRLTLVPGAAVELDQGALVLPFAVDLPPGTGVLRILKVEVDLLPGQVAVADEVLPHRRVTCVRKELVLYPRGIDAIRKRPLATLREALRRGEPAYFRHVALAVRFLPEAERATAVDLLVARVRLGTSEQALVAMAALAHLTQAGIPIGDREGWLRWRQNAGSRR